MPIMHHACCTCCSTVLAPGVAQVQHGQGKRYHTPPAQGGPCPRQFKRGQPGTNQGSALALSRGQLRAVVLPAIAATRGGRRWGASQRRCGGGSRGAGRGTNGGSPGRGSAVCSAVGWHGCNLKRVPPLLQCECRTPLLKLCDQPWMCPARWACIMPPHQAQHREPCIGSLTTNFVQLLYNSCTTLA